ncbi:reverse transcriptase domain-containing protein [Acidihalobacter aeolianus]|uniref:reverse transcriptase domain-containing protein n=1 Tax=Acidihalobacter aeolianus TaxID=2792603 RepID=UPI001E5C7AFF|nr:reverse transcriptase domain-containing protein [Acidihalobacter aeolianus]
MIAEMVAPENMNRAWRHLRYDKAPWSSRIDSDALRHNLPLHLLSLARELQTGHYHPIPVRQFMINKPDGGKRVLSVYYLRDKFAQRLAVQALEPLTESTFHANSYAYRPGRGVNDALACARERVNTGWSWTVDADIATFFDAVPHALLSRVLKRKVPDRQLRAIVHTWLALGPHTQGFLSRRRGLLQGAVISPLLCNLYLDPLDRAWAASNIPFVRYADDFLLFATKPRTRPMQRLNTPTKDCASSASHYTHARRAWPTRIWCISSVNHWSAASCAKTGDRLVAGKHPPACWPYRVVRAASLPVSG